MDNFDNIIKQKVEHFEVPYHTSDWVEMEQKLNNTRSMMFKKYLLWGSLVLLSVAGGIYLLQQSTTNHKPSNIVAKITSSQNTINGENQHVAKTELTQEVKTELKAGSNALLHGEGSKNKPQAYEQLSTQHEYSNTDHNHIEPKTNQINAEETPKGTFSSNFSVDKTVICLGEMVGFNPTSNHTSISYFWDFGDGNTSNAFAPLHRYENEGSYKVTLTIVNMENNEHLSATTKIVSVLTIPNATFKYQEMALQHDDNKLKYPYTKFAVNHVPGNIYKWDFGNGQASNEKNPKIIYPESGEYQVSLTIVNENGCSSTNNQPVNITKGIDLLAMNSFVPQSTNTENRYFMPKALIEWDVQFEMKITDLNGNVIYKTSDKNSPWNGRLNNTGKMLQKGSYIWQVIVYAHDGNPHIIEHGTVNLFD